MNDGTVSHVVRRHATAISVVGPHPLDFTVIEVRSGQRCFEAATIFLTKQLVLEQTAALSRAFAVRRTCQSDSIS